MTKVFADGIGIESLPRFQNDPLISGFTTNPTLIRNLGVLEYLDYIRKFIDLVPDKSVSVEILTTDNETELIREAKKLAALGPNISIKIPIMDILGNKLERPIRALVSEGLSINITAITTLEQISDASTWLLDSSNSYISIFAGRIADTGQNPLKFIQYGLDLAKSNDSLQVIWASPREIYNFVQATEENCHVITMTEALISKMNLIGKDLHEYSLETIKMFDEDAKKSGYFI